MGFRILIVASLLVGLGVAPPPGHPPPGATVPSNSQVKVSSKPKQLLGGPSVEAQKQIQPQENQIQGQGLYQGPDIPQDRVYTQQALSIPSSSPQLNPAYQQQNHAYQQQNPAYQQQNPAYQQQNPAYQHENPAYQQQSPQYLQPNPQYAQQHPAYLQPQQGQRIYSNGYPQQYPAGGYAHGPGYCPQPAGMGYLPSMYNHMPMVITPAHEFAPFSTGYGGIPLGGYGIPQMYAGQMYPQGPQGYHGGQIYPQGPQGSYPQAQGPQYNGGQIYPQGPEGYNGQVYPQGPQEYDLAYQQGPQEYNGGQGLQGYQAVPPSGGQPQHTQGQIGNVQGPQHNKPLTPVPGQQTINQNIPQAQVQTQVGGKVPATK